MSALVFPTSKNIGPEKAKRGNLVATFEKVIDYLFWRARLCFGRGVCGFFRRKILVMFKRDLSLGIGARGFDGFLKLCWTWIHRLGKKIAGGKFPIFFKKSKIFRDPIFLSSL
jgi:hypothetical protein